MSTYIYNLYENPDVRNAIHIVVSTKQSKISDFVRVQVKEKNLSYRKVAEKSGGLITHSTVSDVINKRVTNLTIDVIKGLSKGLGITEQEIFDIARGQNPNRERISDERFRFIAEGYALLSVQQRENLEPLVTVIEKTIDQVYDFEPARFGQKGHNSPGSTNIEPEASDIKYKLEKMPEDFKRNNAIVPVRKPTADKKKIR